MLMPLCHFPSVLLDRFSGERLLVARVNTSVILLDNIESPVQVLFYQTSPCMVVGDTGRPVHSRSIDSLVHFICCEVSSFFFQKQMLCGIP